MTRQNWLCGHERERLSEVANAVEGIILIDGERLAQLMIDYDVGVTPRLLKIPKLDQDYFAE